MWHRWLYKVTGVYLCSCKLSSCTKQFLCGAKNCVLTAVFMWYMGSRWYVPDLDIVIIDIWAFVPSWHQGYILVYKKMEWSFCRQEVTACFTSFVINHLEAWYLLSGQNSGNHWAPYWQSDLWLVMAPWWCPCMRDPVSQPAEVNKWNPIFRYMLRAFICHHHVEHQFA